MKEIPLTQGLVAFVDDDLFESLSKFKWFVVRGPRTMYACRNIKNTNGRDSSQSMHRFIFELRGVPLPRTVDHRDRNGLNNQWDNLRPATSKQQSQNRSKRKDNPSGYIGVGWRKDKGKWGARARCDGKFVHLGFFDEIKDAVAARNAYVRANYGEFGVLNDSELTTENPGV